MKLALLALIAVSSLPQASNLALERLSHDHTIYILSGESKSLESFHQRIAAQWEGGELIDADSSKGVYRYWAYSDRTAPQSRAFMMPAIFSGLKLDFQAYQENVEFTAQRSALDELSLECGAISDPFFITPTGEVQITVEKATKPELQSCIYSRLKDADFTQAEADGIADRCAAPHEVLSVVDGTLSFLPNLDLDHQVMGCIFRQVKATGKGKFGFVGNELHSEEEAR